MGRRGSRGRIGLAGGALLLALAASCTSPPSTSGRHSTSAPQGSAPPAVVVDDLAEVPADKREKALAEIASVLLSEKHLLKKPIDDKLSKEAFPKFLEQLDGAKMLLLEEHVAALTKYEERLDDQLKERDLSVARKGAALVARRRKVVAKTIAELLAKPFDFSVVEELETDPEKRTWAKSEDELRDRWKRALKLQVLERVQQMEELLAAKDKDKGDKSPQDQATLKALASIPPTFEAREEKARKELATRFEARFVRLADMEALEPAEQFLNAVTAAFDPHTQYLAPAEKENFDIAISGKLEGIGAALGEQDHYVVVQELVPGGASWQQGKLAAGDLILAVAQEGQEPVDVTDMPLDKVVGMIRGPKGTVVTLTVKKPEGNIETISITRDVIKIEATYARGAVLDLGPKHDPVGYVYLPGFYGDIAGAPKRPGERNATDDVREILKQLQKKNVSGVILDLRGNGGGLLSHARDISGLFIPEGPIVQARGSGGDVEVFADTDPTVAYGGNLVVMVDRFSASAAEIVAGALQDYERAVIVGTGPTHGKGTVQAVVELDALFQQPGADSLGIFKLTTQQYFRVNGASTQWRGVEPDVVLPDPASFVESGERTLAHSIPWTSVDALKFKPVSRVWKKEDLVKASRERVKQNALFGKVEAFGKLVRERRKDTTEPLEQNAWRAERKRLKEQADAADPKLKDQKPLFEVVALSDGPAAGFGAQDKKIRQKLDAWKEELARDPWVGEALYVLADMGKAR